MKQLVIVESPAKAKTIEKFLGGDFQVMSSYGHVRDLSKQQNGIDISNNFTPLYEVSTEKKKVVAELLRAAKKAQMVWLASDEDREGEAIAWHLVEVLGLEPARTRRIAFHEITKSAVLHAIANPRSIDMNLVNAQQARRILDRLVGFEVSPILWRKVRPSLSAGRVQSVAVRLVVDREREIIAHQSQRYYRVSGHFVGLDGTIFTGECASKFAQQAEVLELLNRCANSKFRVTSVEQKPARRDPAPPFTTSTLQQEASRKLGFNTRQTMQIAQALYEQGYITYMRTDSVHLSNQALSDARRVVETRFGSEYSQTRQYVTKSKSAQEAHEAIRPTDAGRTDVGGDRNQKRLYDLIVKRFLASQMASAQLERTVVQLKGDGVNSVAGKASHFVARGEVVRFDGFLRLYLEGKDDESEAEREGEYGGGLPQLQENDLLAYQSIEGKESFTQHAPRYSEASLVKRLEELGIGRPSTYASIMATVQERGYVIRDDRPGETRQVWRGVLKEGRIAESKVQERAGSESKKLFPTDVGMVVTDFLLQHFQQLMEYNFTASVEEELDSVAAGELEWTDLMNDFYGPFHKQVEVVSEQSSFTSGARELGVDPNTGEPVLARIGRYGPMVQLGSGDDPERKPRYASLQRGQLIETITLEEALRLFDLPRNVGTYEGETIEANVGRFGPYLKFKGSYFNLREPDDPYSISETRAVEVIEAKREWEAARQLASYDDVPGLRLERGRWNRVVAKYEGKSYMLPKDVKWEGMSGREVLELAQSQGEIRKSATKRTATGVGRSMKSSGSTGSSQGGTKKKSSAKTASGSKSVKGRSKGKDTTEQE